MDTTNIETERSGGTYALVITLAAPCSLDVGALGLVTFAAGAYAYVGSALGPGGVAVRVARHQRRDKPVHWHIDYLTAHAPVSHILIRSKGARLECEWAHALAGLPGASIPAPGFGASDCRSGCRAHLIRLPDTFSLEGLESLLCLNSI